MTAEQLKVLTEALATVVAFVKDYESDTFSARHLTDDEVVAVSARLIERAVNGVDGIELTQLVDDVRGDA